MSELAMSTQPYVVPTFSGSQEDQDWADRVYKLMVTYGSFYAYEAPIRQALSNLAAFFAAQQGSSAEELASAIDRAIQQNPEVFLREEQEGEVFYTTSKAGRYIPPQTEQTHMFAQRLYEPENPLPVDDLSVVITTGRPALTTVEPVYISDYWRAQAEGVASGVLPAAEIFDDEEEVEQPAEVEAPAAAEAAAEAEPAPQTEEVTPEPEGIIPAITLDNGVQIDLRLPVDELMARHGEALMATVRRAIEHDPLRRIVSFGNDFYPESMVESFSKGDYRRIREYILEQGEPLLDTIIMADLFGRTSRDRDIETFRFALNYRLNREKDFEFVGVEGARLWWAKGLPAIGTKRLKASELGQIFAYLEEGYDDSLDGTSAESIRESGHVSRFLTFFEWEYGLLAFDAALKALLPPPLLPDQRSAMLRIESPQHYTSYLVELRYPTSNRGGWLQGLEDFFKEFLVPGALITIAATEEPNIFTLQYEETAGEEARLLTLDEKKGRFAFNATTFYCAVDNDLLPSQERLSRLRNMKLLTPGDRRRLEATLAHVFETVGQKQGDAFVISLNDLYLATNVQRSASRPAILATIAEDSRFEQQDGLYLYRPVYEEEQEETEDEL
ncbi:MAG: hypothetical protein KatS3mg057_2955 [Herpetosiphonaceae bacterium]|nr:MAG: hypothetical protein KatS3mg057_2955 [Herpetosiphonaceae bacterium]